MLLWQKRRDLQYVKPLPSLAPLDPWVTARQLRRLGHRPQPHLRTPLVLKTASHHSTQRRLGVRDGASSPAWPRQASTSAPRTPRRSTPPSRRRSRPAPCVVALRQPLGGTCVRRRRRRARRRHRHALARARTRAQVGRQAVFCHGAVERALVSSGGAAGLTRIGGVRYPSVFLDPCLQYRVPCRLTIG